MVLNRSRRCIRTCRHLGPGKPLACLQRCTPDQPLSCCRGKGGADREEHLPRYAHTTRGSWSHTPRMDVQRLGFFFVVRVGRQRLCASCRGRKSQSENSGKGGSRASEALRTRGPA